jgi:uncharacterized coiled-coil DUF342 family protein
MSQFKTITKFNTYLSEKLKNIKLNEYFNLIHSQFYSNIDISFMDYFLELTNNENEFIVEHIKLQEYKVINNLITSANIKKNLERLMLIENEDYQVFQVEQSRSDNKHGGSNGNKKEYKLTPYAFKLCLIRSKNSKEYAKYYLLLEQVFKNYQEYQIMYQNQIINGISNENKSLHNKIDKLLNYGKQTTEKLNEIHEQNEELKDTIDDLNDNVSDIKEAFKETADRSVPNPIDDNERHEFILLQHKELINRFKFIRGIQKYNDSKIQKKYIDYNIIKREYNANPIQLFKLFKDTIKEYYKLEKAKITANKQLKNKTKLKKEIEKIKFIGNDIELQYNYTLNDLLNKITEINNERFNEYNECP